MFLKSAWKFNEYDALSPKNNAFADLLMLLSSTWKINCIEKFPVVLKKTPLESSYCQVNYF